MNIFVLHLCGFISSLLLGYFLMPHIISIAHMLRIVDRPDGRLKRHCVPTAYLGGVGVFIPLVAGSLCLQWYGLSVGVLLFGCTALLLLGLYDDIRQLSPLQRIIVQAGVVALFMAGGVMPAQSVIPEALFYPLVFLWMLTIINAFNLIDVRDGITAVVSMITALFFAIAALMTGQYLLSLLFVVAMGSVAAFFWFNQPPARIYLGDAGSLLLGGFFAAAPMMISWGAIHEWGFLAVPTVLAIPFFEVITLIGVRRHYGIPFYNGSPHHFAHFFERKGWGITTILWRVTFFISLTGSVALLFLLQYIPVVYWLPLGAAGYLFWLGILLRK